MSDATTTAEDEATNKETETTPPTSSTTESAAEDVASQEPLKELLKKGLWEEAKALCQIRGRKEVYEWLLSSACREESHNDSVATPSRALLQHKAPLDVICAVLEAYPQEEVDLLQTLNVVEGDPYDDPFFVLCKVDAPVEAWRTLLCKFCWDEDDILPEALRHGFGKYRTLLDLVASHSTSVDVIREVARRSHPAHLKGGGQDDACKSFPLHTACNGISTPNAKPHNSYRQVIKAWMDLDASVVRMENSNGELPLHRAISSLDTPNVASTLQSVAVVQMLLDHYPESHCVAVGSTGTSPLQLLCRVYRRNPCKEVLSLIVRFARLDPKSLFSSSHDGEAAVDHMASDAGRKLNMLPFILNALYEPRGRRNVQQYWTSTAEQGRLPLHWACANPHISIAAVDCLLDWHWDSARVPDQDGLLPLHILCSCRLTRSSKDLRIVKKLLLANDKARFVPCGKLGRLPLHYVLQDASSIAVNPCWIKVLGGGCAARVFDSAGQLPLHVACLAWPAANAADATRERWGRVLQSLSLVYDAALVTPVMPFGLLAVAGAPQELLFATLRGAPDALRHVLVRLQEKTKAPANGEAYAAVTRTAASEKEEPAEKLDNDHQ